MWGYTVLLFAVFTSGVYTATPCFMEKDIVFILDGSGSIGSNDFTKAIGFIKTIVDGLNINDGTRVGLVLFSTRVKKVIEIGAQTTKDKIKEEVGKITWPEGGTRTNLAIDRAVTMFDKRGSSRDLVPTVAVTLTDGRPESVRLTQAAATRAKAKGIKMIAIGIGNVDQTVLGYMASQPLSTNRIPVVNYASLGKIVTPLLRTACKPQPLPPCYHTEADIVFVLDQSGSVNGQQFAQMKTFITSIIKSLDIGATWTRVGMMGFGTTPIVHFNLGKSNTVDDVVKDVSRIPYSTRVRTHTATALTKMIDMFTSRSRQVAKIGIVMLEGESNDVKPKPTIRDESKRAHTLGIELIAVGIGSSVSTNDLYDIATDSDHVKSIKNYQSLTAYTKRLAKLACEDVKKTNGK